jgi:hypothetical protein
MAFSLSPFESDEDLKESRDYCQSRISRLLADFALVRGEIKTIKKDLKRLRQAVSLWARTFRQCEAAIAEIEATRSKAPTMPGLDTKRVEIAEKAVNDAGYLQTAIGELRKTLDKADLATINRLSRDSALVDAIRVEALAITKPGLNLNFLSIAPEMLQVRRSVH